MKKWLWQKLIDCHSRRLQRRQLLSMDERMRKDLAISRVDAEQLAGRYGTLKKDDPHGE